jgi:hypothetical protein
VGYAELTARKIAAEAGMSLGHPDLGPARGVPVRSLPPVTTAPPAPRTTTASTNAGNAYAHPSCQPHGWNSESQCHIPICMEG